MFGDDATPGLAVPGIPYFGKVGSQSETITYDYPECGATVGVAVPGIPYPGEIRVCGSQQTHTYTYPECGATVGIAVPGIPYFGELRVCGVEPPTPPSPTPARTQTLGYGGPPPSGRSRKLRIPHVIPTERNRQPVDQWDAQKRKIIADEIAAINADDEDIATVIGFWLNRRK